MFKVLLDCFGQKHGQLTIYIGGSLRNKNEINAYAQRLRNKLATYYQNSAGFADFYIYDDWTNSGELVDIEFVEWAAKTGKQYNEVIKSPLQTAAFNTNKEFLNKCHIFVAYGPFGKSTYAEIGYVAGRSSLSSKKTILMLKHVDPETLQPYDIMDRLASCILYSDTLIHRHTQEYWDPDMWYNPIRMHLAQEFYWGDNFLTMTKPVKLPLDAIKSIYNTAVAKLNAVYGFIIPDHVIWKNFKPSHVVSDITMFSGFWGEGKTQRINECKTEIGYYRAYSELHYRSSTNVIDKYGNKLHIPTFLEMYKYKDVVKFENDMDFHYYYYIYTICRNAFFQSIRAPYSHHIVYDRSILDHLAFAHTYYPGSANLNTLRELAIVAFSLIKSIYPKANNITVHRLEKFDIIPDPNKAERAYECELYANKSLNELNEERAKFYKLLDTIALDEYGNNYLNINHFIETINQAPVIEKVASIDRC